MSRLVTRPRPLPRAGRGLALVLLVSLAGGCARSEKADQKEHEAEKAEEHEEGLTPFQLQNGIGPLTQELKVGPLDKTLAAKGEQIFNAKCTACHKMNEKYVGPPLGDVATRRTPTYIMNWILNPAEMQEKHPVARQLLAEYMTQMPNLGLTMDEARAILEYFRLQAPATKP
jgi:mono/diheme cytochrome c family protein